MNNKLNHVMLAALASSLPLSAGAASVTLDGTKDDNTEYENVTVEVDNMASGVELTASEGVLLKVSDDDTGGSTEVLIMGCHSDADNTHYGASTGGGSMESISQDSCSSASDLDQTNFSSLGSG